MATAPSPATRASYHLKKPLQRVFPSHSATFLFCASCPQRPSLRLQTNSNARLALCLAAAPGSPSPPDSDPPPHGPVLLSGTLSRLRDHVQIFFAVLFWMSLFFWSSAWDERSRGKPKKGSRFK